MVVASGRFSVEQVYTAFLAAGNHQFTVLIFEDGRSDLHIEVSFLQPDPVRRYVPVLQEQFTTLHSGADQAVAIHLVGRVVSPVSSGSPSGSAGVQCGPCTAPQSTAPGIEGHHLFLRIVEIHSPYLVRIAGAALRSG